MKKILALILALCLVLSLCACAKQSGSGNKDGKKTLTMWCIATESDANRPAYEKAAEEFKANHPDVDFQWEAFENESYKTKIKAAMSDPESLPDIFFTWAGAFLAAICPK